MAIFGKSKNFKQEYCCSIIKVDNITTSYFFIQTY